MAGKFQLRSRKWDIGILIACLASLALGFGGLFVLAGSAGSPGGTTNLFVVVLGILTFLAFAGPGIVYVVRKRVKAVKARLPGGTMTWIRSHLYLPILALVLALAHAGVVPFRGHLTSGKVLFVLGILVSVAGLARHHVVGVQKAALNVEVAIGKLTTGQPRAFRRLVAEFTDNRRTRAEIDPIVAGMEPGVQAAWTKIKQLSDEVEKHFPRTGGQSWQIRQYKLWRALHPPLTVALFVVLLFHVWDVLGGTRALAGDEERFATANDCAGCHSETFEEWASSTMSHAQTSTINEAQLPITLSENVRIIDQFDGSDELALLTGRDLDDDSQADLVNDNAHVCIDCHAPVGGSFTDDPLALLPFGEDGNPVSGNEAITSDGVGCIVCHTQEVPPAEIAGSGPVEGEHPMVAGAEVSLGGFDTVYGPPFTDPSPLPVRVHGIETPDDSGFWTDDLETSQLCGACHNVKLDIDGDGLTDVDDAEEQGILDIIDDAEDLDADGDFILDENELDDDRVQTEDGVEADDQGDGGDGLIDDLVLQTTFDEWQDYVAFFEADGGFSDRYPDDDRAAELGVEPVTFPNELSSPLGCNGCHMPFGDEVEGPVVDEAPGLLSVPDRFRRQHTFVGVDYDLDPELYRKSGLSDEDIARVVAERDALVQSAATLQVVSTDQGDGTLFAEVTVRNNLLAHSFPTGFAFARQFWLEVSAETSDGDAVCLVPAFVDADGAAIGSTPCGSGFGDIEGTEPVEGATELRQCDARAYEELVQLGLQDQDVVFAPGGSFPPDECDPWLANFQKILTDGDPDGDGVRQEVPYQPLLPDAVKTRAQLASSLEMNELQPVRLRADADASFVAVPYIFQLPDGAGADDVVVTARLRFRHLPPYFTRDLEARQQALLDDDAGSVPEGARIDADELLETMVVSEVVEASSDDGEEQLACPGPQNGELTILACVDDDAIDDAAERLGLDGGGGDGDDRDGFERDEEGLGAESFVVPGLLLPAAWWRRRRARRR